MKNYHDLLQEILEKGEERDDRTGVGTYALFARQLRFDLTQDFPAVTTKKLAWKACAGELLWFIEGSSDERRLAEITHGTREGPATIWTPNAQAPYWKPRAQFDGDLGRVYGVQWRDWISSIPDSPPDIVDEYGQYWTDPRLQHIYQLSTLVYNLKNDPYSRRHILSAWNVGDLDHMALPPCHVMSQYYVSKTGELSCHMYQRSVDAFLGLPFNIASYALLTHMLAQVTGYHARELIISTGDTHIYRDHIGQVREQLQREHFPAPTLWLNPEVKDITKFTMNDIRLENYQCHTPIKAKMAV